MHELIILGILQEDEFHGYQLKQRADKLLTGSYEISYGALYPKFKKLEASGLITSRSTFTKGGQEKIFYNITEQGNEYFKEKIQQKHKESFHNAWSRFQVKLLFFNFIAPEAREIILNNVKELIENEIKALESSISYEKELDEYKKSLLNNNLKTLKDNLAWVSNIK